jgi:hypothetical protein
MPFAVLLGAIASLAVGHPPPPPAPTPDAPPLTLAFYYPWYGSPEGPSAHWVHWQGVETDDDGLTTGIENSGNVPTLGPYDSLDPGVIDQHMRWAKDAGLDGLVVSWWGQGTHEDKAVPLLLDAALEHDLLISLYIERTPDDAIGPRAAGATADELLHLTGAYGVHPAFLRVRDRPVLFTYVRMNQQLTNRGWDAVLTRLRAEGDAAPLLIGDRPPDPIRPRFDGWHTYDPMGQIFHERDRHDSLAAWAEHTFADWLAQGRDTDGITCITICPGYDDRYFRSPGVVVPRDGGATYRTLWEKALEAEPDWILITSFNEWHETSEIEPSAEHGEVYLDITREMTARRRQLPRAPGTGPREAE